MNPKNTYQYKRVVATKQLPLVPTPELIAELKRRNPCSPKCANHLDSHCVKCIWLEGLEDCYKEAK